MASNVSVQNYLLFFFVVAAIAAGRKSFENDSMTIKTNLDWVDRPPERGGHF